MHKNTKALHDVFDEMQRQDERFGIGRHQNPFVWNAILNEEQGEVAMAVLDTNFGGKEAGNTRMELVQVAAVALQWIEDIDRLKESDPELHKKLYEAE